MEDWLETVQGWLNKAGDKWQNYWDSEFTTIPIGPHIPAGVDPSKEQHSNISKGDMAKMAMGVTAAPMLASTAVAAGVPATIGTFAGGVVTGKAGKWIGKQTANALDLNENAKNMFGTIGEFSGMGVGARLGYLLGKAAPLLWAMRSPRYYTGIYNSNPAHSIEVYPQSNAVDWIFANNPELASIGSKALYIEYLRSLYPKSLLRDIVWHGSNADFSKGFDTALRLIGSGAPETVTRADMFFNNRPAASYLYVKGLNALSDQQWGRDIFWKAKEILGKGMYNQENWKVVPWEQAIRTKIPNKKGVFNRDSGGSNGKWLNDYKDELGASNMSDKEFFTKILGFKPGESFNQWVSRNEQIFKLMEINNVANGMYPAKINLRTPIVEKGLDTYYMDRGLMNNTNADGILSNLANNEFGSDVSVVFDGGNSNLNKIWWLGNALDLEAFNNFVNNLYLNINNDYNY